MGTFVGVMGDVSIPKEHWEIYVTQMLAVLTQGGMMQYDTIRLYGKNIMLIHSRNSIPTEVSLTGSIIILKTTPGSRVRWTRPAG